MPTVENPKLTLVTTNNNVEIQVSYEAKFTKLDAGLAGLGLTFHEHIDVIDDDGSSGQNTILPDLFALTPLKPDAAQGAQTIPRAVSKTVSRKDLDVDTGDDEIKVRIRIHAPDMPQTFTEDVFSTSKVLLGDVA